MIPDYLIRFPWIPIAAWLVLYTSDYYLTLWGARLFREQNIFELEGSYELTPECQDEVDNQRKISPLFLVWLIAGALILLISALNARKLPEVYGAWVGYMLFMELAVHVRHFGNIWFFSHLRKDSQEDVTGHVRLSRAIAYQRSALDLLLFGLFTLIAFAMSWNYIFLGGAVGIIRQGYSHWRIYADIRNKQAQNKAA